MDMVEPLQFRPRMRAAGYSDKELRRMVRTGQLSTVRPGAYLRGAPPEHGEARHVLRVRAAVAQLSGDAVVSHVSAALLHGLPIWAVPLDRVHVTRDRRRSGGRRGRLVHVHVAPLDADAVVTVGGIAVTSPERTIVDLARAMPFESAVVTADAALRAGLVDAEGLLATMGSMARWPGLPGARRALAFADGGSASVGESRSRVAIARAGLPVPVLQWEVRAGSGRFIGFVDFGWPASRTVGEFDGLVKYGRLLRPGQTAGDVVVEEKLREDELRATGLAVVRWRWKDLADFTPTADRLRERLRLR